jgi:hypothetical protein
MLLFRRQRSVQARRLTAQALLIRRKAGFLLDQRFVLEELVARLRFSKGNTTKALDDLEHTAIAARQSDVPLYLTTQLARSQLLLEIGATHEAARVKEELISVAAELKTEWWVDAAERLPC